MNNELVPPEAVRKIDKESASNMIKLDVTEIAELDSQVESFVSSIGLDPVESGEFKNKIFMIHDLGTGEIKSAADISSRMLDRPVSTMESGVYDENAPISQALLDLRNIVESLDPSNHGNLLAPNRILGLIPFGNKLKNYFHKYQSAQTHINKIIIALNNGKDELLKDNAAIEEEKQYSWELMHSLEKYILFGKQLDEKLQDKLSKIEDNEPEKARVIKEEILFYTRQKVQDMLTQLAVLVQGYLAMDMIRKNNLELIKGVDRATTTTVSALRTAVTVAQALVNEKLVLDQISALNETTGNIIEATSNALKQQAANIHEQATASTIEIEKIKTAFVNIYETMDMIDKYKIEALEHMGQTVNVLTQEIDNARKYLEVPAIQPDRSEESK